MAEEKKAKKPAGMENVAAAESRICKIMGQEGGLYYRGYDVRELAEHSKFDETSYLLWTGELPTEEQYDAFRTRFRASVELPPETVSVLRVKLKHLNEWNHRRRSLAARYDEGLDECGDLVLPLVPPEVEHVYHQYVIRTPMRNALREYLTGAGISSGLHYPRGVHLQQAYAYLGYQPGSCPRAEQATAEVLSLPLFPQLSAREMSQVVRLTRFFFAMR